MLRSILQRPRYLVAGLLLLLLAVVMPTGWYDAIPRRPDLPPPPFRGVTLLRLTLLVDACLLLWLSTRRQTVQRIAAGDLLVEPAPSDALDAAAERRARWGLAAVTLLALVLRLISLDADLWLDEITPILDYSPLPAVQVLGSYLRSNNHLLNTLLVKGATALFGEHEWSVRLPAMIFGVATIPALYFVSRLALSRAVSLGAALLLAVSYHHIFFSQSARGYTAYLFFALVASGLFVRALSSDRPSTWVWYVLTLFLGFASLLNTLFVMAAHGVVGLIAVVLVRRRAGSPGPLLRRLVVVFAAAAFLGLQLYATALPEILVVITTVYARQATGFAPFTLEFLREVVGGVAAGFGPGIWLMAIPFLVVAALGYGSFARRNWALTAALTLPGALTAVFLSVRGLTFSPRFFLLWLPLAIMSAAQGVWLTAAWAVRRTQSRRSSAGALRTAVTLGASALVLLAAVSALALPRYYRTPKQPYRAALRYMESVRRPGDRVAIIHTAEKGVRYYLRRSVAAPEAYSFVRTVPAFDSLTSNARGGRILVLTTFRRALRLRLPVLHEMIERGWRPERRFPATVGDGSIIVWLPHGSS